MVVCVNNWIKRYSPQNVITTRLNYLPDHLLKTVEQISAVVWSGRGFGVVLYAEGRLKTVTDAFDGVVVEVEMRYLKILGKRIGVDGETVILGSDFDLLGVIVIWAG